MKFGLLVSRPGLVREGLLAVFQAIPGIRVLEPVDDGISALRILESRRVDLVILDSSLPEEDLVTTATEIKNQHGTVRCLALTDKPSQTPKLKVAGADDVLTKGLSAATLIKRIKALLA